MAKSVDGYGKFIEKVRSRLVCLLLVKDVVAGFAVCALRGQREPWRKLKVRGNGLSVCSLPHRFSNLVPTTVSRNLKSISPYTCTQSGLLTLIAYFFFKCAWTIWIRLYSSLQSQRAFYQPPLLIVITTKFISKVIIPVLTQDKPGSKNTVHKSTWHSRALCLFRTFPMSVVYRKKVPILISPFLAYHSTLEYLIDLGK